MQYVAADHCGASPATTAPRHELAGNGHSLLAVGGQILAAADTNLLRPSLVFRTAETRDEGRSFKYCVMPMLST